MSMLYAVSAVSTQFSLRSAYDVYLETLQNSSSKVKTLYVGQDTISDKSATYEDLWENCKTADGIQKARCVKPAGEYMVELFKNSNDETPYSKCCLKPRFQPSKIKKSFPPQPPIKITEKMQQLQIDLMNQILYGC